MPLARSWRRYRGQPGARRSLLREALQELLRARLLLAFLPFRRLVRQFGSEGQESPVHLGGGEGEEVEAVGWAVRAVTCRVPWDSLCLAQAMAASRMLSRRGLASTLYFGVRQERGPGFSAHAWLRCGDRFVTGGQGREDYTVLCRFASPEPGP